MQTERLAVYNNRAGKQDGGRFQAKIKKYFSNIRTIEIGQFIKDPSVGDSTELLEIIGIGGDGSTMAIASQAQELLDRNERLQQVDLLAIGNGTENVVSTHANTRADEFPIHLIAEFLFAKLPFIELTSDRIQPIGEVVGNFQAHSIWHTGAGFPWDMLAMIEQNKNHHFFGDKPNWRKIKGLLDYAKAIPQTGMTVLQHGEKYFEAAMIYCIKGQLPYFTNSINVSQNRDNQSPQNDYVMTIGEPHQRQSTLVLTIIWNYIKCYSQLSPTHKPIVAVTPQPYSIYNTEGKYMINSERVLMRQPRTLRKTDRHGQSTLVKGGLHVTPNSNNGKKIRLAINPG